MEHRGLHQGISVVVICLNEEAYIEDCLESVATAGGSPDIPEWQLVIADGGSTDGTIARARAWAARAGGVVLTVVETDAGYGRQRNAGVSAARHPWVAFISADVRVPESWLAELAKSQHESDLVPGQFDLVSVTGGRDWLRPLALSVYPTCSTMRSCERTSTVHLLARRSALVAARFDESLRACEDKELAYRLRETCSERIVDSRPQHLARESRLGFLRKLYRESEALSILGRRYGSDFPDCFGWRRHARRSVARLLVLAVTTAALAHAVHVPRALLALALLLVPATQWHRQGWSRVNAGGQLHLWSIAPLYVASMTVVTAGQVSGAFRSLREGTSEGRAEHDPVARLLRITRVREAR